MMTFNNKFKKTDFVQKKVIKILFLNLLRQNSKVYSLASRFDVQRNNVHLHGGTYKKKTKFEYFSGAQNSCFGACGKCT